MWKPSPGPTCPSLSLRLALPIHCKSCPPSLKENLMSVEPFVETAQSASPGQSPEEPVSLLRYLRVSAVADTLNISKMTDYRLVHSGETPAGRFGKLFRISQASMEQYRRCSAVVIHQES